MTTENISVTLGVDYHIQLDVSRFDELMDEGYVLTGEVRVKSTKSLIATFNIVKSTNNKINIKLLAADTKEIAINKQFVYVYDILAINGDEVLCLVNGVVNFEERVTTYAIAS
jgi:hypothetical protein